MEPTLTVYGAPWCPHCKRVKRFLAAHRVRYAFVDIDTDPDAIGRLKELQDGGQIIPTVIYADGTHEVNPSDETLARRIGLSLAADRTAYDLVIIGGGPAGLAAAIYAAREGIDAIVVDTSALGGQAGISDRIENYPGFPDGISGAERVRSDSQFVVHTGVDLVELEGEKGRFSAVVARDRDSGETLRFPAAAAFVFIGLKPNNGFLGRAVERDPGGFLMTGPTMETSVAGVFAAGDVRSGSTKQLGSAVGDGIAALLMTRRYLEAHHHKAVALAD